MPTPLEVATAGYAAATRSLGEAQDRLNAYMDNPANKPLNTEAQDYKDLTAAVTRCDRNTREARQTFTALLPTMVSLY